MQANPSNSTSSKLIWGFVPLWVIQVSVVGIIAFAIYYFFIRVPKYAKDTKVEDTDGDGKPDDFNPTDYTNRLKEDLIGLNAMGHDFDLHTEVLSLSNGRLHAIYDDWQKRVSPTLGGYMPGSGTKGDSLAKTIADEIGIGAFESMQTAYAKKFKELNLV